MMDNLKKTKNKFFIGLILISLFINNFILTAHTETGSSARYCMVCYSPIPDAQGEKWVTIEEATCTQDGRQVIFCEICKEMARINIIPRLMHRPAGNWVVVKKPMCNEIGRRVQYCIDCNGEAISENIPALTNSNHVFRKRVISGSIFSSPIVREEVCRICGFTNDEKIEDFSFAWESPVILFGFCIAAVVAVMTRKGIRKSIRIKKSFVCPYCFKTPLVSEVQFRCDHLNCKDVDDIELTKYEGGNTAIPLKAKGTFAAPKTKNLFFPKNAICPGCGYKTSKIICPSCHNNLPESTINGEDMIISVVGSRDVGKSHFVGVIIKELIDRVAERFDGSMEGFDDAIRVYDENFGRRLYDEKIKLDITKRALPNNHDGAYKPYKPMIFTLKKKGLFTKIKNYTLVFYDTAGEDLNESDTMNTVNRYICESAGIIFLLDPMQIWSVRSRLEDEVVSRASSVTIQQAARPDEIMTRVSKLIRNDKNMDENKKISIPVAAVFSKYDTIERLVPQGCTVRHPSPHCSAGAFVMTDWYNVNSEIENLLKTWGATSFVTQLKNNYTNYSYFAVSSLGLNNNPGSDGRIKRPEPHRIEDALLWILKENGVIKSKK